MNASSPIRAAYLDTPEGQLHYFHCAGAPPAAGAKPKPPVLLLHMSASSARSMLAIMRLLVPLGYDCFAPDMPGFGGSFDPTEDPPAIAYYAELYSRAFTKLPAFSHGSAAHIIGHHSGGIIGTELAGGAYNLRVRSLTSVGASVMTADDRAEMAKTFLEPFNRPVASGAHFGQTWDYLIWEGLSGTDHLALTHRETLDHVRAWQGRSQIYACVWAYDCAAAMDAIPTTCPVLGLCARDDVLWPYYANFSTLVSRPVHTAEIKGGNFGPDLDAPGIVAAFLKVAAECE